MKNPEQISKTIKKTQLWKKCITTVALAGILASCNQPNDKIILNESDKSVKFNVEYYGREPISLDISVTKEGDTYHGKIREGGDLYVISKSYESNDINTIFTEISDYVGNSAEKAGLSSTEKVNELSSKGREKVEYAKGEYRKVLDNNKNSEEDIVVQYPTSKE